MVEVSLKFSDELAERVAPFHEWLPTILELTLVGFKTLAVVTATEIIEFLSSNPSPKAVFQYHVSQRAQERLRRLLALNSAGLLGIDEQRELDELAKIEHILSLLKAHLASTLYEK